MDNKKVVSIAYVVVVVYDPMEATIVCNHIPSNYFIQHSSGSNALKFGGVAVKTKRDLLNAVSYLESIISNLTHLPFSLIDYGTMLLQPCNLCFESGEISEKLFAHFPSDAAVGDTVEVFSIVGKNPKYLGGGVLVDGNTVAVDGNVVF